MFLTPYIVDILLVRSSLDMIKATEKWLSFIFEIKDVDEASYVLVRNYSKKLLSMH